MESGMKLPWSPEGEKLLSDINMIINQEGGRISLAYQIMQENHEYFSPREHADINDRYSKRLSGIRQRKKLSELKKSDIFWSEDDILVISGNYGKVSPSEIANRLGKDKQRVYNKIKHMKRKGLL